MSKYFFSTLLSICIVIFSFFLSGSVYAQETDSTISAKIKTGGSYELFWPLTAGKTKEDPMYFLKTWKEGIGGMFIFNVARKADYEVTLSTKRILEAEKLLNEGKEDSAKQTLDKALAQLTAARGKFSKATKEGNDFQAVRVNLFNQLSNLDAFIPKLAEKSSEDTKLISNRIGEVAKQFLGDVR